VCVCVCVGVNSLMALKVDGAINVLGPNNSSPHFLN
jgi:hypothetical protein